MITIEELSGNPVIRHGFFTREGGVSEGLYGSLNCGYGSDDQADNVTENRKRVVNELGVPEAVLLTCYQQHTATALVVEKSWSPENAPIADGMATKTPGLALGILTADCAPVLFADESAGVIGAAHGGWQGALGGIVEATLQRMTELGATIGNIKAAIGPSIAQSSYEVGPEFFGRFNEASADYAVHFRPSSKDGHHMFDLAGFLVTRLREVGVAEIAKTGYDTRQDEHLFYSYRRSVLQGEKDYGREISVIVLAK
ncbi:MAG: peptidoglycan editing factor PgeF [Rhodospirillaceae bacterium]|nr:peptidoglycan editing factor PgeF [Rhodospirillaceae bacterium]